MLSDEDGDEGGGGGLAGGRAHPLAQLQAIAQCTLAGFIAARGQAAQVVVAERAQQEAALRRPRNQRPHRPHPEPATSFRLSAVLQNGMEEHKLCHGSCLCSNRKVPLGQDDSRVSFVLRLLSKLRHEESSDWVTNSRALVRP